jgi:peptidoglycan/LPS O-acetylase OafA/YrhL
MQITLANSSSQKRTIREKGSRLDIIDLLRGLAAISVFWCHWGNGVFRYGRLGVEVFFVISGFIIPYALSRANYKVGSYWRFLLKRLVRLEPPYIASILIIVAIQLARNCMHGMGASIYPITVTQALLHVGYVNVAFGYPTLNGVYWTLAVEFQYYFAAGLIFPLISHPNHWVRGSLATGCIAVAFPHWGSQFLFGYLPVFLCGMAGYNYYVGLLGKKAFIITLLVLGTLIYFKSGAPEAIAAIFTICCICFVKIKHGVFLFFGRISYSLYLLHLVIYWYIYAWVPHLPFGSTPLGRPLLSFALCIAISYLFYALVEYPAQRLSSIIRYQKGERPDAGCLKDISPLNLVVER